MTILDNFWQFLTIFDNFWQFFFTILTIVDNFDNSDKREFYFDNLDNSFFSILTIEKTILETCDIWDTDYNSANWEPEFMTIFVTWQLIVTLDSIRNFCDVFSTKCLLRNTLLYTQTPNDPSFSDGIFFSEGVPIA